MQLVRIAGPTDAMRRLQEVEGLDFERSSANRLDDDTWQVAGYATDEALAELESRGLTTELVVPAEKVAEDRETLYASITREEDEPAPDPGEPSAGYDDASAAGPDEPSSADPGEPSAAGPDEPSAADPEGGDS